MARLKEKIAYALGDAAAGGIVWKVMSIAFPLFFTNVFGLSFADAAVLMLVARMFDVVTDPLMGTLADRTQSRFGTYRPWLIYGAIPFGLIFALLLYTPGFGPVGKRIYAYALYLLMMAVYTMVNVPYGSLLGVMTEDDDEKNQFSSFRMVGAYAMGFVTLLSFPYLQKMVGGTAAHQYAVIGAVLGIIAAVMTLACGLLTKERLKPKRAEKFSFQQFADLVHNKAWLYMTAIAVCTNFFNGFRYAVAGYMFDYCLHGNVTIEGLIINYTVFMAFGEVTCMIFGGVSPWFTRLYADVADYHTEHFGTSATGLIFSSGTMSQKFGTAISGSLIALFLGWAGANMITDKMGNTMIDPASVTDSVLTMVWSLFSLFPAVIAFLLMVLAWKFPIRK